MKAVKVTENYKAVLEGKLAKGEFVRQMRLQFPNIVTKFNGYDDTVQILKNKQMIFDAPINEAFENVKVYDDRPALTYSLDAFERGVQYELQAAGVLTHDKFNIKADTITGLAFLVGIVASITIGIGFIWLPILLLWLSGQLDVLDGSVARLS